MDRPPSAIATCCSRPSARPTICLATFTALLDIAEAEAGSPRGQMLPLDLALFARDLADLYEPVAEEAGLTPDDRHAARSRRDPRRPPHAVARGREPGRECGQIHARWRQNRGQGLDRDRSARLTVADDGPGIPVAEYERVFDRFYRLEASRTTEGNGLGLSLARAVVRLHGGTITLADNGPRVGCGGKFATSARGLTISELSWPGLTRPSKGKPLFALTWRLGYQASRWSKRRGVDARIKSRHNTDIYARSKLSRHIGCGWTRSPRSRPPASKKSFQRPFSDDPLPSWVFSTEWPPGDRI